MKLIDILVEELPKRGGWPAEALFAMQDYEGLVKFSKSREKIYHDYSSGHVWCSEGGYAWITNGYPFEGCFKVRVAKDNETAFISREQYEAALAASKQGWNGEGMPPIGSKVSFFYNERYDYHKEIIPEHGQELEVVAHKTTTDGHDVAVCYWDKSGGGMAVCLVPGSLLPISSEADKKRDSAIANLTDAICGEVPDTWMATAANYAARAYDAIEAGKIPGIRIE